MEPFGENSPPATKRPVQRACDARADRHHAAPKRIRVACFDEQMRMGGLQRVVNEPEVTAVAGRRKAPLDGANEADGAERWKPGAKLDGHVGGKPRRESVAWAMRNARRRPRLPSGAGPAAAPPVALAKVETELQIASQHRALE